MRQNGDGPLVLVLVTRTAARAQCGADTGGGRRRRGAACTLREGGRSLGRFAVRDRRRSRVTRGGRVGGRQGQGMSAAHTIVLFPLVALTQPNPGSGRRDVRCERRVGGAQSRMVKSAELDARTGSCGWKSTAYTRSVWPRSRCTSPPARTKPGQHPVGQHVLIIKITGTRTSASSRISIYSI